MLRKLILASVLASISLHASASSNTDIFTDLADIPLSDLEFGVYYDEPSQIVAWIGPMDQVTMVKFRMLYEDKPITKMVFRSAGGLTEYGFYLGDFVRKNNIPVEIAKQCDSACTLVALQAPTLSGKGKMGFHLPFLKYAGSESNRRASIYSSSYVMAKMNNDSLIDETLKVFRKSPYIGDDLIERIKRETDRDNLIDIDIDELLSSSEVSASVPTTPYPTPAS